MLKEANIYFLSVWESPCSNMSTLNWILNFIMITHLNYETLIGVFNPFSANPTKGSNTLKRFDSNCTFNLRSVPIGFLEIILIYRVHTEMEISPNCPAINMLLICWPDQNIIFSYVSFGKISLKIWDHNI